MPARLQPPTKELDVNLFVFFERYATDLLKWDILTLFARNPSLCAPAAKIAQRIGLSLEIIWPELGDLVILGILERMRTGDNQALYRLSENANVQHIILKFAEQVAAHVPD